MEATSRDIQWRQDAIRRQLILPYWHRDWLPAYRIYSHEPASPIAHYPGNSYPRGVRLALPCDTTYQRGDIIVTIERPSKIVDGKERRGHWFDMQHGLHATNTVDIDSFHEFSELVLLEHKEGRDSIKPMQRRLLNQEALPYAIIKNGKLWQYNNRYITLCPGDWREYSAEFDWQTWAVAQWNKANTYIYKNGKYYYAGEECTKQEWHLRFLRSRGVAQADAIRGANRKLYQAEFGNY